MAWCKVLIVAALCGCAQFAMGASDEVEVSTDLAPFAGQIVVDLTLEGNHVTKDWLIAREIWTTLGDVLDLELVKDDLTRLENLAIFGSVVVQATELPDGVGLNYHFTEMPWIIPYPAVAYTEENGFSLGLGVASPNFGGRGVTLSASAVTGGTTTYRFAAKNPWIAGNHVSLGLKTWYQTRRNELLEFDQASTFFAVNAGKYIGQSGRLNFDVGYYSVSSNEPGRTINPSNTDEHLFTQVTIGYDNRDSWRVPHDGWDSDLAVSYLGGDANTWSVATNVIRYQPIKDRHTIATGPYLGIQSGTVGVDVPSYVQFFLGGANSVRGYALEELGKEIFGKNQLLYSLEYRYLIVPTGPFKVLNWTFSLGIELAAFGDAGVAWSYANDFNLDRTHSGYGIGVRLLVPGIESLRFDVGHSEKGDTVFNFGVKTIFGERSKRIH